MSVGEVSASAFWVPEGLLWLPRPCLSLAALCLCPWAALDQAATSASSTPFSLWGWAGESQRGMAQPVSPRQSPFLGQAPGGGSVHLPVSWPDPQVGVQARGPGRMAGTAPTTGLRRGQREGPSRGPASLNPGCNPDPHRKGVSVPGGWGLQCVSAVAPCISLTLPVGGVCKGARRDPGDTLGPGS